MLGTFYYSIAGKKTIQLVDDLIQDLLDYQYTSPTDKKILRHVQNVAKYGNYPASQYFDTFYEFNGVKYNSKAELTTYVHECKEFFRKQALDRAVITAVNESNSPKELLNELNKLVDEKPDDSIDQSDLQPVLYSQRDRKLVHGIDLGIKELDEITNGGQPGTMGSVCAFTGEGKSTLINSAAFKNAYEGKKVCMLSLELAPELMWKMFEARYMYQVKGLAVTTQDFIFNKIPSDVAEQVESFEEDFKREIASNLIIIDESKINKNMMLNYRSFGALMRSISDTLGVLDMLCVDHVGQFELMWPDCGNNIIKTLQSWTKTSEDQRGIRPFTLMAVQANREGNKRAKKRDGVYDLQAISDLNEVERSSTYIIFLFTSDDMKITQETKVTLNKHRLGSVITEPIVTTFNPAVITVGSAIEAVSMSDDDFNSMDIDFGGGFDADDF